MKARLLLEDGSEFEGISIGVPGEKIGEVVLNTAVVGYQEMMTDPANAGKILVLTYPLIGNYGVASKFYESRKAWVAGLAIKEESRIYSNWQAEGSFSGFLASEKVTGISDIDTRTLAVTIRDKGEMLGMITNNMKTGKADLLKRIKSHRKDSFLEEISVNSITQAPSSSKGPRIAILDLGILNCFIKQLRALGASITLLPFDTDAKTIVGMKPDGLIISSGPENDEAGKVVVETVKKLLGKVPMLGIAVGHEMIGIALGGRLKKMKAGHHGVNYPVRPAGSFKGDITVQNHSYVVDDESLKHRRDVTVTLRNINDHTVEAMESKALRFLSVQYYPVSPGFDEINDVFYKFMKMAGSSAIRHSEVAHAKA